MAMARAGIALLLLALAANTAAGQPAGRFKSLAPQASGKKGPNEGCKKLPPGLDHIIRPKKENGAWGYMADGLVPAAIVRSGDIINLTIPSGSGTLLYDEMVGGDPELEELFKWDEAGPAVSTRGALGGGEGTSWNVGPIHVCSAKPGDVLQVDFMSLKPRLHPKEDTVWGVLVSAQNSGYAHAPATQKDLVTAFSARLDQNKTIRYFMPDYTYTWQSVPRETSCVPEKAEYPNTLPEGRAQWANEERMYSGLKAECVDGKQVWDEPSYPGLNIRIPYEEREWGLGSRFIASPDLHVAFAGVAPATGTPVSGAALGRTGGLLNQKRLVQGTSLFLPIEVKGAQLFLGKGHFSSSDGMFSGAALEGHLEAQIRVTLHSRKDKKTPKWMRKLQGPVIETAKTWIVQSVTPSEADTNAGGEEAAESSRANSVDGALKSAADAATSLIGDMYEMEPAEVRRVVSFGLDFGINSVRLTSPSPGSLQLCPDRHLCLHQWHPHTDKLAQGGVRVHAIIDRASMDFFETASEYEREISEAEDGVKVAQANAEKEAVAAAAAAAKKGGEAAVQDGDGAAAGQGSAGAKDAAGETADVAAATSSDGAETKKTEL